MTKYANILGTVGNTPVVKIGKLAPPGIHLYVKVEAFNPLGSVKDRLALGVIEDAERSGALKPGQTVIEASSGNTGIGLAMVCAQKGYPLPRRKSGADTGRGARLGHGQEGGGVGRDEWLVPDAPVRE
jgi:cysteine synthase